MVSYLHAFINKMNIFLLMNKYKLRSYSLNYLKPLTIALLIGFSIFFTAYNFSKSRKSIEFIIGNVGFGLKFSGYLQNYRSYNIKVGEIISNCGMEDICPDNHFPIHLHSGRLISETPKICVNSKYVIHKSLNNTDSCLYIVVWDVKKMEAVSVKGFGYKENIDPEELEKYLKKAALEDDIIMAMTFNEASGKLNFNARQQFVNLGSGMVQNLQYRFQWYFITQKSLNGFTPFEQLYPFKGGEPNALDVRICIPTKIKGRPIVPDYPDNWNHERDKLCLHSKNLGEFCSGHQRFMELEPAALVNKNKLIGNAIFHSPILVLSGDSLEALSLTLESLQSQPGIHPDNVVVSYNSQLEGVESLAKLFHFTTLLVNQTDYASFLEVSLEKTLEVFVDLFYLTVVEPNVLLSPDFLQYLATAVPLLQDSTVFAISAWNPNGFSSVSSRPDLLYRVQSFSGAAFAITVETVEKDWLPFLHDCCQNNGFLGWSLPAMRNREMIIPDVSRCFVDTPTFRKPRNTNVDPNEEVKNVNRVHAAFYDSDLKMRLLSNQSAHVLLKKSELLACLKNGDSSAVIEHFKHKDLLHAIAYRETDSNFAGMKLLFRCFGLLSASDPLPVPPLGIHKGTLRFSHNGLEVILLSNRSSLFNSFPYFSSSLILP